MSIAHPQPPSVSQGGAAQPLWQRTPGAVVLFDNASHKGSASRGSKTADVLLRSLADAGWDRQRINAHEAGMKGALASLRSNGADLIIAFGGDGTVAACAEAALESGACLLPIPGGTMNLTAKDLGIESGAPSLVDRAMLGTEHSIDAAHINGRLFLHSITIGLVPAIGRQREAFRKRSGIMGRAAALVDAGRIALQHKGHRVEVKADEHTVSSQTLCAVVSNNRLVLHHDIEFGRASLDAGNLGLYLGTHRGVAGKYRLLQTLMTGQLELDRDFRTASVEQVSLDSKASEMLVSVDGEIVSMKTPLVITQRRKALRVIVPGHTETGDQ